MTDIEQLLEELAGPEPEPLDLDGLHRQARQHHRGRRATYVLSGLGLLLIVVLGARSLGQSTTVETGPVGTDTTTTSPTTIQPKVDDRAPDSTAFPQGLVPYQEASIAQKISNYLAALEAQEWEIAARLPDGFDESIWNDGFDLEGRTVTQFLEASCEPGCNGPYSVRVTDVPGYFSDGRYLASAEVTHASNPDPFPFQYVDLPGKIVVVGLPAAGEAKRPPLPNRLFGGETPRNLVIARNGAFEIWHGENSTWVPNDRADLPDLYVTDGWLWGEGGFQSVEYPSHRCDFPLDPETGQPFDAYQGVGPVLVDGRLVAEMAAWPVETGTSVTFDCGSGEIVEGPWLFEAGTSGEYRRRLFVGAEEYFFQLLDDGGGSIDLAGRFFRLEGSLISGEDRVGAFDIDQEAGAVAYLEAAAGSPFSQTVTVRHLDTGELAGRWDLGAQTTGVWFDGRWVVGQLAELGERAWADGLLHQYAILDTQTGTVSITEELIEIVDFG